MAGIVSIITDQERTFPVKVIDSVRYAGLRVGIARLRHLMNQRKEAVDELRHQAWERRQELIDTAEDMESSDVHPAIIGEVYHAADLAEQSARSLDGFADAVDLTVGACETSDRGLEHRHGGVEEAAQAAGHMGRPNWYRQD